MPIRVILRKRKNVPVENKVNRDSNKPWQIIDDALKRATFGMVSHIDAVENQIFNVFIGHDYGV